MEFYTVVRQYYKGDAETHSMELKTDFNEALVRYFNILATDLGKSDITWNACYIIDDKGTMLEGRVFDRRPVDVPEEA